MRSLISLLNAKEPSGKLNWDKILLSARYHNVTPLLFSKIESLEKISIPKEVYLQLKKNYKINLIRNTFILEEFEQIRSHFQKENIPVILLKGIFFLRGLYKNCIGIRLLTDMDILIKEEDQKKADGVLRALGYNSQDDIGTRKAVMYFCRGKDKTAFAPVHLHRHIVNLSEAFIKLNCSKISVEAIWQSARPVNEKKECNVFEMSLEHALLALCEHALRHGFCRINIIYDIHFYVTANKDNFKWDKLKDLAVSWNLAVPLYFGLFLSHKTFETDIPEGFLRGLQPEGISITERFVLNYITKSDFPKEDICVLLYLALNKNISDKIKFIYAGLLTRLNS